MRTRQLGKYGPQVPVICFGALPLGGGMGAVPEKQAIETTHAALDCGITFIDTAEAYRTSESVLGKALKGRRHQVVIATKLSGELRERHLISDHSMEHMNRAIENSLRALQTDYIDLYQLHFPDLAHPIEQTLDGLLRLKEAGKIRYIGVSNFSPEETAAALKVAHLDSSQPRYNMLNRQSEGGVLPFCRENGIGVIVHTPLAKGLLTGKYKPGHEFAPDDERSSPGRQAYRGEGLARTLQVIDRLKEWAEARGRSLAQLAIAWTLAHPAVTSSIVGAKSPEQVRENAVAGEWSLAPEELEEIDAIQGGFMLGGKGWTVVEQ